MGSRNEDKIIPEKNSRARLLEKKKSLKNERKVLSCFKCSPSLHLKLGQKANRLGISASPHMDPIASARGNIMPEPTFKQKRETESFAMKALYNELKDEIYKKVKESIMEEMMPLVDDLIRQAAQHIKVEEQYQSIEWFINKYPMSRKTFFKYKKLGYVDFKQIGRHKYYHVKQWLENLNKIKGGKPDFLKRPL
jgi:hypothetical protein